MNGRLELERVPWGSRGICGDFGNDRFITVLGAVTLEDWPTE